MLHTAAFQKQQAIPPLDRQQQLRDGVRQWLEAILKRHDIKPRQLALTAGVAPSTIYRALDENSDFVMSTTVAAKIARHFGEPPGYSIARGAAQAQIDGRGAAQLQIAGLSEGDVAEYDGDMPQMSEKPGNHRYRARITSDVLNLDGFQIGDIAEFDLSREPRPGDIVVAQKYHTNRFGAETVLRRYQPPFLITRSTNPAIDATPLLVDNQTVLVMGTFVRLTREAA